MSDVSGDGKRDAMAFIAAMARGDTAAVDAVLAGADLPVMSGALASMIIGMMDGLGIEDVSAHVQAIQRAWNDYAAGQP